MYKIRDMEVCGWSLTNMPAEVTQDEMAMLIKATKLAQMEFYAPAFDTLDSLPACVDAVVIDPESGVYIWTEDGCIYGPNTYPDWMTAHIAHVIFEESAHDEDM